MRVEIGPVSWRALEESGNEDGAVTVSTRVLARLGLQLGQLLWSKSTIDHQITSRLRGAYASERSGMISCQWIETTKPRFQ